MKLKSIFLILAFFVCFESYSQDTIVKTNKDTVICKIVGHDNNTVYFTISKEGKEISSFIDKREIEMIKSGSNEILQFKNQPVDDSFDKISLGLGIGLDYGGLGGSLLYYPITNIGFFAGLGYPLAGLGYNIGAKFRFVTEKHKSSVSAYLLGMYGYNAVILVQNATSLNKLFYGPTFGLGIDYKPKHTSKGYWSLGLYIPLRGQEVSDYVNDLKNNHGVKFSTELLPITISIGYRFLLN